MSNIRPISDPAVATAMVATFQSIETACSAPAGISAPRWRILQCAYVGNSTAKSLMLCSGLDARALAEHVQALRWKGLMDMAGYGLSPTAILMVEDRVLTPQPVSAPAMDPADVPACMRPDCTPPAPPAVSRPPIIKSRAERLRAEQTSTDGRRSAAVARPLQGEVRRDRVAPDRAPRTTEEVAGSNPAAGQPAYLTPSLLAAMRRAEERRSEASPSVDLKWDDHGRDMGGDAWQKAARASSEALLAALRRHHPERCGEA